jgi:hypothetical protein
MKCLWYWLYDVRYRLKFVLSGDCGHSCDWAHSFGWVPEEGCPVHDVKQKAKLRFRVDMPAGSVLVGEIKRWPIP